jgi:hypothetical protein
MYFCFFLKDKTVINEIEELAEQFAKRLNAEYWPISSLTGKFNLLFFKFFLKVNV